jgi:hypothetical protein
MACLHQPVDPDGKRSGFLLLLTLHFAMLLNDSHKILKVVLMVHHIDSKIFGCFLIHHEMMPVKFQKDHESGKGSSLVCILKGGILS